MRVRPVFLILMLVLVAAGFAATPGSFRGFLMEGADTRPGWMYVQSRNHMLRLVRIKGASVYYSEEIPAHLRRKNPAESLKSGAEVRVTAQESGNSKWQAREIEILTLAPARLDSENQNRAQNTESEPRAELSPGRQ